MDIIHKNITSFFEDVLSDIRCQKDTRAYIVSIFGKYKSAEFDLSKNSITVLYAQASHKKDFLSYQNIGDWLFYANIFAPAHLKYASKDYYTTVARLSYYSCYRIINKQWPLFEELADNFLILEQQVKNKLNILIV